MEQTSIKLPADFETYGEARKAGFLRMKQLKDQGAGVVGMFCSFVPTELVYAAGAAGIPASAGTVCGSRGNNRGSCLDREAWRSPPHNRNRACGKAMYRPVQTGPSGIWFYDTTCVPFFPLLPCKDIVQYL